MVNIYQLIFYGKIKRFPFLLSTIAIYILFAIFIFTGAYKFFNIKIDIFINRLPMLLVAFVPILILCAKRLRDIGLSPWFSLLMLLSVVDIVFLKFVTSAFYIFLVSKKGKV